MQCRRRSRLSACLDGTSTWPIPDGLDAATAACVPVAFGTAQKCLFTAGNLKAGQTALIHAGAGGVGMAVKSQLSQDVTALYTQLTVA